jgi:transketolase
VLTRQNLPQLRTAFTEENRCAAGAYELLPAEGGPAQVSLFATGSEVAIAAEARRLLAGQGIPARVVSVPCFELLARAPAAAKAAVIGTAPVRIGIEAAVRQGWDAVIGSDGEFVGMTGFGASAPAKDLYRHFGITAERAAEAAMAALSRIKAEN